MGLYLYANRRHAHCLSGSATLGNTSIGQVSRSFPGGFQKELAPIERALLPLPINSQPNRLDGRFGSGVAAQIDGIDLQLACSCASWKPDNAPFNEKPKAIPVLRGRDCPAACADSSIGSSSSDWKYGSRRQASDYDPFAFSNSCYPLFVEKTADGWGSTFLAVTLLPIATVPTENDFLSVKPPLFVFTLWRVTPGNREPLDRRIVCSPVRTFLGGSGEADCLIRFRAGLARNSEGDSFAVVQGYIDRISNTEAIEFPTGGVVTLSAPFTPASEDACVFGQGLLTLWLGNASRFESRPSDSMRLERVTHDQPAKLAFNAGCLGLPDTPGLRLSGRQEWLPSRFWRQPVTQSLVSCAGVPQDAPESGDSSSMSPQVDITAGDDVALAYRNPAALSKITATALATHAFGLDSSGMAPHHASIYLLRESTAMTLLNKKFSNAQIDLVGRATANIPEQNGLPAINLDGTQEIDKDFLLQLYNRAGRFPYFPPLGEFSFSHLTLNGVSATNGSLTANVQQSCEQSTIPIQGGTQTRSAEVSGELYAFFDVVLQEQGQYRFSREANLNSFFIDIDGVETLGETFSDLDYAKRLLPSPLSPNGRIVQVAHHVDGLAPSPLLRMSLFCRTSTSISGQQQLNNGSSSDLSQSGHTACDFLGFFTFSKEQTAALMNGDSVAPTTWVTEPQSPKPVKMSIRNPFFSSISQFWVEIKGVTLETQPLDP